MTDPTYNDLIVEAFIDSIRSVLVVDDDYPTLHEVLLDPEDRDRLHGHKDWNASPEGRAKVRKVIDEFRKPDAPYILDIHDASPPGEDQDEAQAGTLQQTDLLILDYQLNKAKENDGAAAVRIARQALCNEHFNLLLVHTQNDIEDVFHEFLIGFMQPIFDSGAEGDEVVTNFAAEHEVALHGTEGQRNSGAITDRQYADARRQESISGDALRAVVHSGKGPWGDLKLVLEKGGLHRSKWEALVRYALATFEILEKDLFADREIGLVDWRDGDVKFIRASRGFVTFKSKSTDGELMSVVRDALFEWQPLPSRLTLTKLRAEMNSRGIEVQDDALGERDIGGVWYLRLLQEGDQNLDIVVDRTVRNHSEQLLDQLLPKVSAFAKKMRMIDLDRPAEDVVLERFALDLTEPENFARAKLGHNAFVGSKPINSVHLELGHIMKIAEQYWVCLTPACDMVPAVYRGKPLDRMDFVKRFTAAKLFERPDLDILSDASRGGQIFVNLLNSNGETERRAFSISPEIGASPAWMTMYADDSGYLSQSEHLSFGVSYVMASRSLEDHCQPVFSREVARVCGMLRYEYALEIQSRFISSQSRIGLDFDTMPLTPAVDAEAAK